MQRTQTRPSTLFRSRSFFLFSAVSTISACLLGSMIATGAEADCLGIGSGMHWEYDLPESANSSAVYRTGSLLLVGFDEGANGQFDIYDVSNPSDPILQSSTVPGSPVTAIDAEGDIAFLATWNGIQAMDMTDPSSPTLLGAWVASSGNRIDVQNGLVYVERYTAVQILDFTDPTNPQLLTEIDTPDRTEDVHVDDAYLYVAEENGLSIYDVTDPAVPVWVRSESTPARPTSVTACDGIVYLGSYSGLYIVDAVTPAFAFLVAEVPASTQFSPEVVAYCDGALVFVKEERLLSIDASDPANPVILGRHPLGGTGSDLTGADGFLWTANPSGVTCIDATDPTMPLAQLGIALSFPESIVRHPSADVALVPRSTNGLTILDVSDPDAPLIASELPLASLPVAACIEGNLAYVAGAAGAVDVVDISDPWNPVVIGSESVPGNPRDLAKKGDLLYVVGFNDGMQWVDVSDPAAPFLVGNRALERAIKIVIEGDLAYVGANPGLHIFSIANPALPPGNVATLFDDLVAWPIAVDGVYAYVGVESKPGLTVLDVTTPTSPVELLTASGPEVVERGVLHENVVYATDSHGVATFDASVPDQPQWMGYLDSRALPFTCAVVGDRLFISSLYGAPESEDGIWTQPLACAPTSVETNPVSYDFDWSVAPSPFSSAARIRMNFPVSTTATISIFDSMGRFVSRLRDGAVSAGDLRLVWDGLDAAKKKAPAGVYFVDVRTPEFHSQRTLVLVR